MLFRSVQGSGFRVQGSGFRVQGSGFGVQGSGFRVQGSGFRVQKHMLKAYPPISDLPFLSAHLSGDEMHYSSSTLFPNPS